MEISAELHVSAALPPSTELFAGDGFYGAGLTPWWSEMCFVCYDPRTKVRPEGLPIKIPVTTSEIEPATFRLLAQCLSQLPHLVPPTEAAAAAAASHCGTVCISWHVHVFHLLHVLLEHDLCHEGWQSLFLNQRQRLTAQQFCLRNWSSVSCISLASTQLCPL
jgi:hypothetical protein